MLFSKEHNREFIVLTLDTFIQYVIVKIISDCDMQTLALDSKTAFNFHGFQFYYCYISKIESGLHFI